MIPLKQFLVSLMFSQSRKKGAPLVAEAVIFARSMEDAKRQLENNDVKDLKVLYYGHSRNENFVPRKKGTESDFEEFLGIATNYKVRSVKPEGIAGTPESIHRAIRDSENRRN